MIGVVEERLFGIAVKGFIVPMETLLVGVPPDDETTVIFRRYIRNRHTGKLMDARQFGRAAWPIRIRAKKPPTKPKR